ncbi:MAG: septum formation initiator family protein [Eubacteriales bacterium]|nr:septum formation initiator family protein [Eubacteriales bacterium]
MAQREMVRPQSKKRGHWWLVALVVAALLAYSAITIYQQQEREMERLQAEAEELQLQYEAEVRRGKQVNELNAMVGSAQYIERLARDNLGLVKPDEIIFIHR